jgi:protein ImuB
VLAQQAEGTHRLMAVDAAARHVGLEVGMALAQARAMVPGVEVQAHDAAADARLLEGIADWADRYTPMVGRSPPDGLLLDITGAAHLQGGEAALCADLLGRLARQGVTAVAALAPTPGAAWALARAGSGSRIVPPDVSRDALDAALAPLPVSGLRLATDTVSALRRVGLKRIGDLIGRPRAPLAARFGAALVLRLDQARGIDTEAINPRQPVPPAEVELSWAEPILTTAAVASACAVLAAQLADVLTARGQGATALQLAVYRVDGLVKRIDLRLASPCRHAETMAGLLTLRLGHLDDPLDPGFGYDLVRLAATNVAASGAESRRLPGFDSADAPAERARAQGALIDRLTARFGAEALATCVAAATHIPERAARVVPLQSLQMSSKLLAVQPQAAAQITATRPRPLRLFDPPELVEVMAEVPDGPPLHVRWRRRRLRIVSAEGPERIEPEWWTLAALAGASDARTRDYWRIEDAAGRRLWIYRDGLYGAAEVHGPPGPPIEGSPPHRAPKGAPRWYVHGLFA